MDIGQESTTNNHVQDQTASHRKKRSKINGAAEAPPAKRIKSSTDSARPKVSRTPRAPTTRTRTAKSGDSKWLTVVPSTECQVPSDLVLVDARPRLWSMNRAELGAAFVEVSDSKCVNGISWASTDMPIFILDNESMVLEKSKDAGNELSMDLVLIREFRYANPNTVQKDADSPLDYLSLSQMEVSSRPVHSLAATPSMIRETPDGLPMDLPVSVAKHTTTTLSTSNSLPISESKSGKTLQEQRKITELSANKSSSNIAPRKPQKEPTTLTTEAHLDPTPPLVTKNPISQSTEGGQPSKGPQKTADKPLLRPVQDAFKSEELESSNNDSVPASAIDHGSTTVPDISNSNAGVAPKRKRVKPAKVQCNPSDESLPDPEKAVSRSEDQEKPVLGPPPASTQIPDPSEYRSISAVKSKQGGKKREASLKSSRKPLRDTARNLSRFKKRENADESFPVSTKIPVPSDSSTAHTPKLTRGGKLEVSRKPAAADSLDSAQGKLRLKEQNKPDNEILSVGIPTSDHVDSISTARSMTEGRKAVSKSRKTVRLATDESLLEKSDTGCLSRLNTGMKSKGAKEGKRKHSEKIARELFQSDPLPKSKGEGVQRTEKATKRPSKRTRSPGPSITTSAYARKSNSGREEHGVPVRNRRSECASQPPQNKEPAKPIKEALSLGEATQHVPSGHATEQNKTLSNDSAPTTSNVSHEQGQRKGSETRSKSATVMSTLRFKKYKDVPMHVFVPKTSESSPDVPQSSPEKRRAHLDEQPSRPYTPDRSIPDELENIIRGQKGRVEPVFNHYSDNRLLPNFNRLPLGFVDQHDTPHGVRVAPGDVADVGGRTLNRMDGGHDEYRAGDVGAHIGSVETRQDGTAGWGPTHWNEMPTGMFAEWNAPRRDPHVDRFVSGRADFGSEMRPAGGSGWGGPFVQHDVRAFRQVGHLAGPGDLRAYSHSPVPTSPWITTGLDNRSKSAPCAKPPLGPRAWLKLQEFNSKTAVVAGASDDPATTLSCLSNLSPNLQRSAVTSAQSEPSLALAASSIEDIAMVLLPDKLKLPTPSTQPFQSIVSDGTSLINQMNTCPSPTTPSVNDITMGFSVGKPLLPASPVPVSIEPNSASAFPSPMPPVAAATDISMETQASQPALSAEPLPPSITAPPPSLKRKGKEKAPPPESSHDEQSIVQDEVRQAKKAKLWHDPIVDVSRIFSELGTPMACSSKTKLEDLPVTQSSRFPQTSSQTSAVVVDDQVPSLSISPSGVMASRRRGRPPKNAKVALSLSGSVTATTPGPVRGKIRQRQPSSLSNSVPQSTYSSQTPAQATDMVVEDHLPSSSVSVASQPVKRRGRKSQTVKVVTGSSATAPVTSGSTLDELSSISGLLHETPLKVRAKSSLIPATPVQRREDGVPLPIPGEIQALIDAYINGVPIGIFASNSHIQGFWGLKLVQGEEIGYAFMGFYRVCRVLESLEEIEVNDEEDQRDGKGKGKGSAVVASDVSRTRVRWRFKLRWEPGGEGWQIRDSQRFTSPWWNSNLNAQELAVVPRDSSGDSDDESTEAYRLARRGNQNFSRRHCHFAQTFCSVLPLHLLAPVNAEIPDAVLPRGWHCPDCGKLNFRYYLRHRSCDSSYCREQDKPLAQGYIVEVDRLRDPQNATALSLPLNVIPEYIRANSRIQVWKDRVKTLVYCFKSAIAGAMARVQHIFTCNLVDLQQVPSELFNSIQMDVPLRRPTGDAHMYPYFVHIVDDVRGKGEESSSWMTAPQCLHRAKEMMTSRGRKYGKKTAAELDINKLIIRAWVTSGSKRGSDLLQAKERCIVVMCLGCEVILSISPKSAMPPNDNQTRLPDLDKLIPMESLHPQEDQLTKPEPGESANLNLGEKEGQPHVVSASSTMRAVMGKNQRGEKVEMTLSLVHGDVVLLEGDDFEYSIKRTGTSILLFGLSASSRHPRQAPDSGRG